MIELKELSLKKILEMLKSREITCVQALDYYLDRIEKFDKPVVNAISQLNPDARAIAEALDADYENKKDLPLYGLPFLVKENIATGDKMRTSAGALCLENAYCKEDAPVVAALRKAGAVLMGKASCTELANFMATLMPGGYSALYDQVHNPYNPAIPPSGSSTGSAAATSMNFCAFSIGTDTGGSVLAPSMCQGTCGLRPAGGTIDIGGIIPISHSLDAWGPICRCAEDVQIVFEAITGHPMPDKDIPVDGLTLLVETHESTYMDENKWKCFNEMLEKLKGFGVKLIDYHFLVYGRIMTIMNCEMKHDMAAYFEKAQDGSGIKSLKDIIEFNRKDMPKAAKYGQARLEDAEAASMEDADYQLFMKERVTDREALIAMMKETGALGILAPAVDSVGPYMGFAGVTLPFGKLPNGVNYACQVLTYDNALAAQLTKALEPCVGMRFTPEDVVTINPENVYPSNAGL